MNKKLILLVIILLIIILLGCIFITNEGFKVSQCSENKCSNNKNNQDCVNDPYCKWNKNNCEYKCSQSECSLIHSKKQCNSVECIWDDLDNMCKSNNTNEDSNCNKITIKTVGNIEEKSINTVCPTDPKCVATCIDDHTWIKNDTPFINTGAQDMTNATLKSENSAHLITSSRCMECIKNFFPIISLIKNHNCNLNP